MPAPADGQPAPADGQPSPDPAEVFAREARSLVARLRLWTPQRWSAAAPPFGTRADVVHHLAGALVRLTSETERALPRLGNDLVLPDQLAVAADDLVRARPERAGPAGAHLLLHRSELLAEPIPPSVGRSLGLADVRAEGRRQCSGYEPVS